MTTTISLQSWLLSGLLLSRTCSFTVAQSGNGTAAADAAGWPYKTFRTANFTPPELLVKKSGPLDDGYLFLTIFGGRPTEKSPLIMTDDNDLIWNGPLNTTTSVFSVQTYRGEPILAYWTGSLFSEPLGRGYGIVHLLDKSYDQIAAVSLGGSTFVAQNGQKFPSAIDLHEVYITENDTLLVTANNVTQTDLTSVGGPINGWVTDSLIYEIDIATDEVLFKWSALEHQSQISLNLSVYPLGSEGYTGRNQSAAWGYFHINAVSPLPGGGYLISSRYLCSAIAINKQGDVQWLLQVRTPQSSNHPTPNRLTSPPTPREPPAQTLPSTPVQTSASNTTPAPPTPRPPPRTPKSSP